jgi:lipoic acid synthetase
MILGGICSRGCRFCNVESGGPELPDEDEPGRVAEAVRAMGLRDVVITSVTRDDLEDGGAGIWAATIRAVRSACPGIVVEVLIPDFNGSEPALRRVLDAEPHVLGHNLETVPSQYPRVRPQADYGRSLEVLARAHAAGFVTKSGIMVGLGETEDEVTAVMRDARGTGCNIFYVGQYLQPSGKHLPVDRYVEPAEFGHYREAGKAAGFDVVVAEPLVRSSFHSEEQAAFLNRKLKLGRAPAARCAAAGAESSQHEEN